MFAISPRCFYKNEESSLPFGVGLAVFFPIFYIFTLMWWIPEGDKYVPGLVLASGIAFCFLKGWNYRSIDVKKGQKPFLVILWAFVIYSGFVYGLQGGSWSELKSYIALGIYCLFSYGFSIPSSVSKMVFLLGAVGLTLLSMVQFFLLDVERVGGFYNPIPFATALLLMVVVCAFFGLRDDACRYQAAFFIFSGLLVVSVGLTGTRGVVLAFLFLLIFWVGAFFRFSRKKINSLVILSGFAFLLFVFWVLMLVLESRFQLTLKELAKIEAGEFSSSIGLRLEMWRAGLAMIPNGPILGLGDNHYQLLEYLHRQGKVSDALFSYMPTHYHNQFLDLVIKKGVVGFSLFLILLVFPVYFEIKHGFRIAGVFIFSLLVVVCVAGLTDVPFHHPSVVYLYFGIVFFVFLSGSWGRNNA